MKVALVVRRLSTHGGTERFALGLSRYLVDQGHRVDVWCAGADERPDGVSVRPLRVWGRGRLLKMLALERAARRVNHRDHDVVLGFSRMSGCDLYRAGGGCHQAWMDERRWSLADEVERELDRRVVLSSRRVVVNSRMAGDELVRHYGLAHDRLRLVRNGVDTERFRPDPDARLPAPAAARTVAFLGSGWSRKGLSTAMRAIALLKGVHLVVLGTDPRRRRYEALAERLGVADRVHLMGAVDHPERLLPAAGALVLPTRYDPSANAILEAMACGVPAITSGRDGAAEILPESWMSVQQAGDVEGFAAALERALQDKGLRDACRDVALRWPSSRAYSRMTALALELAADPEPMQP